MSFIRTTGDVLAIVLSMVVSVLEAIVKTFIPAKYKMKSIVGEVALVTGGGGGLGRLLALRLANLGAIVVVWDINKAAVEDTVKLVRAAGGTCYGYVCDLCNREEVYKKAALVREEVGTVTILINNAGVVNGAKFMDTPDNLIIRTMDVNVMSHFWTVKAFLPGMMQNNKGHIVSIASMAGHIGIAKLTDYCSSKFAALGFEEALNYELHYDGYNIHTTVVCPFFMTNTGMFTDVRSGILPLVTSNEVAEQTITAMRCNQRMAMVPGYFRILVIFKWVFPWASVLMFLRNIVPDASPPTPPTPGKVVSPSVMSKEQNGANIHQQLTRRISSSERKP